MFFLTQNCATLVNIAQVLQSRKFARVE